MARGFAKRLNATLAIIDKRRPKANVAEVVNVVGEVGDRDCLLVDDMIDTAGTMCEAARALKKLGARDVYVCATHALLSGPAVERLADAPIAVLSVGELLSKAIRYIHSEQSVSSLFE
jgi:ribose-phosphate pyrophosphokinase